MSFLLQDYHDQEGIVISSSLPNVIHLSSKRPEKPAGDDGQVKLPETEAAAPPPPADTSSSSSSSEEELSEIEEQEDEEEREEEKEEEKKEEKKEEMEEVLEKKEEIQWQLRHVKYCSELG